jgi:arginyl-tRNA synthetase
MDIQSTLIKRISQTLRSLGIESPKAFSIERSVIETHGEFATNVALVHAKELKKNPRELAEQIVTELQTNSADLISKIEIAGPGFINLFLVPRFYTDVVLNTTEHFGSLDILAGKKVLVEYTDPNAFKPLHIGHLMNNALGESISRIIENAGAEMIRMCYPSDIGLHIAKAVWAITKHQQELPQESDPVIVRTGFLGKMYVYGTAQYEQSPEIKAEIDSINKKLFEKSDADLVQIYETGKRWSLEHFEEIYKKVGTVFNEYIFESEISFPGKEIVLAHVATGVFEKSDGAVVYKGEKNGLHTRVFINSTGLPTYEAKEIGLNTEKFRRHPELEQSIIITASEQNEYFKVVLSALSEIDSKIAQRTKHIGHGMMRFASGKMSSRTGNVITGESMIEDAQALVHEKIAERAYDEQTRKEVSEKVGIGAIKYTILRSSPGSDIIYDEEKAIAFEGDSGPYIQYSVVRARSVLAKATGTEAVVPPLEIGNLERLIATYPQITRRAYEEFSPHTIAGYLIELAREFNAFYAQNKILEAGEVTGYRLRLTQAVAQVLTHGLNLLGIQVPKQM